MDKWTGREIITKENVVDHRNPQPIVKGNTMSVYALVDVPLLIGIKMI